MHAPPGSRPGLAKTHGERLVLSRVLTFLRASDGRFRTMFETADVVTEGSVRTDDDPPVWYGTTSIVLPWPATLVTASARAFVATVAARDPHVRVRAMRTARREASLRAPAPLGCADCQLRVEATGDGLRIDVDVQAPLTLPSRLGALGRGPAG
jgi:hypothetical protein